MSLTRPTDLPIWATTGTKTTPSAGKQAEGWTQNEAPPFDFFNWHQNSVYNWVEHLDDVANADKLHRMNVSPFLFVSADPTATDPAASGTADPVWLMPALSPTLSHMTFDINALFHAIDAASSENVTLTGMKLLSFAGGAGSQKMLLERYVSDNTGAGAATVTTLETVTNNTELTFTTAYLADFRFYNYRLRYECNSSGSAGDFKFYGAILYYTRNGNKS